MIRGISFEVPQATADILWRIMQGADIQQLDWYVVQAQTEVWDRPFGTDFFTQAAYKGPAFSERIRNDHFIVFLKLQAYPHSENFQNISTYEAFVQSNCQLRLLVYDCSFVEVYAKSRDVLHAVFQNAVQNRYNNVAYITDSNDARTTMDIR